MEFLKKHFAFVIWLAGLATASLCNVSFWLMLLGSIVYGLLLMLLRFYKTAFWIGYLLQGVLKKPAAAFDCYEFAYRHGGRAKAPMLAYGMQLMEKGAYSQALEVMECAAALPEQNPAVRKIAQQNLALACDKARDPKRAALIMEQLLAEDAFFTCDFYTTLGYYYIEMGEYAKAKEITERALQQDENFAAAYDNLGLIAYHTQDIEGAEKCFHKALSLYAHMISSQYYLGLIAEQKGDKKEAAKCYAAAHAGDITGLNTVTREMVDEKHRQYIGLDTAMP